MNDRLKVRAWTGCEGAVIVVACVACWWSVGSQRSGDGIEASLYGIQSEAQGVSEEAAAAPGAPRKSAAPGTIWPHVERVARVEAPVVAAVAKPPPFELLGIAKGRGGEATAALLYDGRSDTTLVMEAGESRDGVLVRQVSSSSVEIRFDGVEYMLDLVGDGL